MKGSHQVVGVILLAIIGYGIYNWQNKSATIFVPIKNKTISKLFRESELIKDNSIKEKGDEHQAKSILEKLEQECKQRGLIDKEGNLIPNKQEEFTISMAEAFSAGQEAEKAIVSFEEEQKASNNDSIKKKLFHQRIHKIIGTLSDKKGEEPTDKQIKKAFEKLVAILKDAQEKWDQGEVKDKSYEDIYTCCKLVEEYQQIKKLLSPAVGN